MAKSIAIDGPGMTTQPGKMFHMHPITQRLSISIVINKCVVNKRSQNCVTYQQKCEGPSNKSEMKRFVSLILCIHSLYSIRHPHLKFRRNGVKLKYKLAYI